MKKIFILGMLVLSLFSFNALAYCGGAYSGGDWLVTTPISCQDEYIGVNGTLTLTSSGILDLTNVALNVTGNVTLSGNLSLNNGNITFSADDLSLVLKNNSYTKITNARIDSTGNPRMYQFRIIGGVANINNTFLNHIYTVGMFGEDLGGIAIDSVYYEGSLFKNLTFDANLGSGQGGNYCFNLYGGTIVNNRFEEITCDYGVAGFKLGSENAEYIASNNFTSNKIGTITLGLNANRNNFYRNIFNSQFDGNPSYLHLSYNNATGENYFYGTTFKQTYINDSTASIDPTFKNRFVFESSYGSIVYYRNNYSSQEPPTTLNINLSNYTGVVLLPNLVGLEDKPEFVNFNQSAVIEINNLNYNPKAPVNLCTATNLTFIDKPNLVYSYQLINCIPCTVANSCDYNPISKKLTATVSHFSYYSSTIDPTNYTATDYAMLFLIFVASVMGSVYVLIGVFDSGFVLSTLLSIVIGCLMLLLTVITVIHPY